MTVQWISAAGFIFLALLCVRFAVRKPGATSAFALITFLSLALVTGVSILSPSDPPRPLLTRATHVLIAVLLLFPWGLYRFSRTLSRNSLKFTGYLADLFTIVIIAFSLFVADFTIFRQPDMSAWSQLYLVLLLIDIIVLPLVASVKIYWNSRHQAAVVRSRMRLLAAASGLLTLALVVSAASGSGAQRSATTQVITQTMTLLSALLFIVGLSAPRFMRTIWGQDQRTTMSNAASDVIRLSSNEAITSRFLGPMAEIAGSTTSGFFPDAGVPILSGVTAVEAGRLLADRAQGRLEFQITGGRVVIWTTALWPFVENDEQTLLDNCAGLLDLSLKRQLAEEYRRQIDVSRAVEETLRGEAEQRERIIEERTAQLQQSNDDLRQFAYAASHDLQAPLRTVAGFSELLFSTFEPGTLTGQQKMMADHMQAGVLKMQQLIQDLLSYGKIASSSSDLCWVELAAVMNEVRTMLAADLAALDVILTVDARDRVLADEGHVRQVLQNLVQNSIAHASPDRQPEITVTSSPAPHSKVRIVVADNGVGIATQDHQRIFEMFKQLRAGPGTGMGLALVRRIVERYGGEIQVESQLGHGATFILTLPATAGGLDDTLIQGFPPPSSPLAA